MAEAERLQGAGLMRVLSQVEQSMLAMLKRGPRSCTDIGSDLWGTDARMPQAYARPAGRVLARLRDEGLVEQVLERRRFVYRLTIQGRQQKGLD